MLYPNKIQRVKSFSGDDWRRGVVFVKEIVPKPAIALVARVVYNENYVALPMRHSVQENPDGSVSQIEYSWELKRRWNNLAGKISSPMRETAPASLEEFITEHYWGYAAQKDGGCVEYQVEHPRWKSAPVSEAKLDCDTTGLYPSAFAQTLGQAPSSAFLAEGSPVTVYKGVRI